MDKYDILYDFIESESSIRCLKCGRIDTIMHLCEYEAAEYFYEKGWRFRGRKIKLIYCPECCEKLDKKNKK